MSRAPKLSTLLRVTKACEEAREWAKPYATLQAAWDVCPRGEWMLWLCGAVKMEHPTFEQIAYVCANAALRDASKALRSAADAHPDATHAETPRHQAALLDACTVDSSAAAGAARAAATADLVRQHIPDVTSILEAYAKRRKP